MLGAYASLLLLPAIIFASSLVSFDGPFGQSYSDTRLNRRAINESVVISDGQVMDDSLAWGDVQYWSFLPPSTTNQTFYITLNTCSLPIPAANALSPPDTIWNGSNVPILTMYGSIDPKITRPTSQVASDAVPALFGFANLTYTTGSRIYLSVQAPPYDPQWTDSTFAYQIGISSLRPLHAALAGDQNRFIFLQDSDFSAALLTTGNLTSANLPNYQIWINPSQTPDSPNNSAASIQSALKWSWCGITKSSAQVTVENADRSMTTRGPGGLPKEQFYVHDLQPSTFYDAYITLQNNYSQGGTIWPVQQFRTRDTRNCQVIYNLDFCAEVAYSVPSNHTLFNPVALGTFYDDLAESYYQNFSTTLQTYNCQAKDDAIYSLVSTCEGCRSSYKDWICAATIPRCADLTNPGTYLVTRNASRNPSIDDALHPGPYKEVLPCVDLLQTMTRQCPVVLGLRAPKGDALSAAYGQRSNNATVTCNAPGVDFWVASGKKTKLDMGLSILMALFCVYWVL